MKRLALFVSVVMLLILAVPALAANHPQLATQKTELQPGNYCLTCHLASDKRLEAPVTWRGGIERTAVNPCPAALKIDEEVYYTERLLLAIERAQADISNSTEARNLDAKVAATAQGYSRLLDAPLTSLNAFSAEAQLVRFRLGKSYQQLNQVKDVEKGQSVLFYAGLVTLVLLVALGWGWLNVRKALLAGGGQPGLKVSPGMVVMVVLVLVVFALPIFRVFAEPVASSSVEEQERQAVLDSSKRSADTGDRALGRAWELGRIGAAWNRTNPGKADASLKAALEAQSEAQKNLGALWGEAQAAQEAAIGSPLAQEKAANLSNQLISTRSRAWALRLMAAEWATVDPQKAGMILDEAQLVAFQASGKYRDLDLRGIAATWGLIKPGRGADVAAGIADPAIKNWAYRELAIVSKDMSYLSQAAAAARQVQDPVQRARVLGETAALSKDKALAAEALAALKGVEGAPLAFGLADLAVAAGDAGIAAQIGDAYPGVQAYAYCRLEQYEKAWVLAARISDPFEQGRAQAAIAAAWKNGEAADKITNPLLRDLARRDIVRKTGDAGLVNSIQTSYYRIQSLAATGQTKTAWDEGQNLNEKFPLLELGLTWVKSDPKATLVVVDKLDRETDKARLLRALAANDQALFDRAAQMALAARQSGDPLAPVEALLALAYAFPGNPTLAQSALSQAYDAALKISIK